MNFGIDPIARALALSRGGGGGGEGSKVMVVRSGSYVTLADSASTSVPALTTDQFIQIYSWIGQGYVVLLQDMLGENISVIRQRAEVDGQDALYMTYLDRLELKYSLSAGTVSISFNEGSSAGVIVEASTNKTVNGLQVPSLTDDQLLAIYNATVAGKPVTITDATGKMHFTGVTADMVSDEVFVSFVYFDKMVLEYGEGNATTFKEILTTADLPKIIRI